MKKILALLLAMMMVFALAACGGNEENPSGSGTTDPGTSQQDQPGNNDGNAGDFAALAEKYSLPGLTAPEGSTVDEWGGGIRFQKDGGFTEEEINTFAQAVWDVCNDISTEGIYNTKTVDTSTGKQGKGDEYASLSETMHSDECYWYYTYNDAIRMVRIYFGAADRYITLNVSRVR